VCVCAREREKEEERERERERERENDLITTAVHSDDPFSPPCVCVEE